MENLRSLQILKIILAIIAVIGIIGGVAGNIIGIPFEKVIFVIERLLGVFVGIVFSIITSSLIEAATGHLLKRVVLLSIKIAGKDFSITLFTIAVLIVNKILFGGLNPFAT